MIFFAVSIVFNTISCSCVGFYSVKQGEGFLIIMINFKFKNHHICEVVRSAVFQRFHNVTSVIALILVTKSIFLASTFPWLKNISMTCPQLLHTVIFKIANCAFLNAATASLFIGQTLGGEGEIATAGPIIIPETDV